MNYATVTDSNPVVRVGQGLIRGENREGVAIFRGIPYGAPCDGTRRFLPPLPAENWDGVRDCTKNGPIAVQFGTSISGSGDFGAYFSGGKPELFRCDDEVQDENCLVLNVLTPGLDDKKRPVTNIVLMGSGEPLDNYDEVVKFLRLVSAPEGMNISPRNISISTCGLVPQLMRFTKEAPHVTLSVSLHAPNDETRDKIMPINRKYRTAELLNAAKYYAEETGRRVIFEYALIKDVNSSERDAKELASRLKGINCHVNLIPLNHVEERHLTGVTRRDAEQFASWLQGYGTSATVRREMGSDIDGACGQLRRKTLQRERKAAKER